MQKKSNFLCLCYILTAIRAGRCRERRYADHTFVQIYFRMHHFVVKFSKFSSASGGKGALTPLTKIMRSFLQGLYLNYCTTVVLYYWRHCPHSMRSRVYVTVGRPSVRPSVPSIDSSNGGRRVCCWALCGQEISNDSWRAEGAGCRRRRSAANAGSVMLTANGGGSKQACW